MGVIELTQDERWMMRFTSLVKYINFYHCAPPSKSIEYSWIHNQITNKLSPDRQKILDDMAPGIINGKIADSINKAMQTGTKYIEKYEPVIRKSKTNTAEQQKYIDIMHGVGVSHLSDIAELLYRESLHIETGNKSLAEIYNRLGLQQSRVENINLILSDINDLPEIADQYRILIKSNRVGVGNIRFANKITGSINLRELIKEAVIINCCKEALYSWMGESQKRVVEGVLYRGLNTSQVAKELKISRQSASVSFKSAIDRVARNLTPLIKGENLSLVEKLKPTLNIELSLFEILLNSYNNEEYKLTNRNIMLISFRLGLIGEIGEGKASIDSKLNMLRSLIKEYPDISNLGIPKNIGLVGNKDIINNIHKSLDALKNKHSGQKDGQNKKEEAISKPINLTDPLDVLNLSQRTYNILRRNNINTVQQLKDTFENKHEEINNIRGMGSSTLDEITLALNKL